MDAIDLFLVRYQQVHGSLVGDLLKDLSEVEIRRRPHHAVNTIAWLVWHAARVEDVGVNRFIAARSQVLTEQGWLDRMNLARRDVGTGMDDAEVDELSVSIDLTGLRGYWEAVGQRTVEVAESLRGQDLTDMVGLERVTRAARDEGAVVEKASWLVDFWAGGRTRAWFLAQVPLLHVYGHYFEARVVKGLWGHPSP
jgi:DinB family protein